MYRIWVFTMKVGHGEVYVFTLLLKVMVMDPKLLSVACFCDKDGGHSELIVSVNLNAEKSQKCVLVRHKFSPQFACNFI